jgi:hypothetical protein
MKIRLVLMVMACLLAFNSQLQAAGPADVKERLVAAHELFKTMHYENTFTETIENMVDMQIKQNPAIEPFRKVMLEFFSKYMSWNSIKDDVAQIYAEEFSVQELKELNEFYSRPVGQKSALRMPQLMSKGSEFGMRKVQQHMPELQHMVEEEMKRLSAKEGKK